MGSPNDETDDHLRPEYDLSKLVPAGERGKYAERCRTEGITVTYVEDDAVRLDPDVRKAFPTSEAVNNALRGLMQADAAEPTDAG